MSRSYRVGIRVEGADDGDEKLVAQALDEMGYGMDVSRFADEVYADDELTLGGGKSTDEWADEAAKHIWSLIKRPVTISIDWWYLERDPDDGNYYDENDFSEMFPALTQLAMTAEDQQEAEG